MTQADLYEQATPEQCFAKLWLLQLPAQHGTEEQTTTKTAHVCHSGTLSRLAAFDLEQS